MARGCLPAKRLESGATRSVNGSTVVVDVVGHLIRQSIGKRDGSTAALALPRCPTECKSAATNAKTNPVPCYPCSRTDTA